MIKNIILALIGLGVAFVFSDCSKTTTSGWVFVENEGFTPSNADSLNRLKKTTVVCNSENGSFEEFKRSNNRSDVTGWRYNDADNEGFEVITRQKDIEKELKKREKSQKRNEHKSQR